MKFPAKLANYLLADKLGSSLKLGPEDRICIDFANRLRVATIECRINAVWLHIANEVGGGLRTRSAQIAYAKAKALGFMPGAADYLFLWNGGNCAIEFKAPGGEQKPAQASFEAWCAYAAVPYHLVYSADEAEALLLRYGVLAKNVRPSS